MEVVIVAGSERLWSRQGLQDTAGITRELSLGLPVEAVVSPNWLTRRERGGRAEATASGELHRLLHAEARKSCIAVTATPCQ